MKRLLVFVFAVALLGSCNFLLTEDYSLKETDKETQIENQKLKEEIEDLKNEIIQIKHSPKNDFSEQGGGNPGSSTPKKPQPVEENPAPKQVTQEETPVGTPTSNSNDNNSESTASEEPAPQQPKNDLSDLFGHGSVDNPNVDGQGEGTGIGTGKGREVLGKPRLVNPKRWNGIVMIQFTIDADGNVISADVLFPHPQTTLTLTKVDQKFIEEDCKRKFKFTPTSSGYQKDRFVKMLTYINV